MPGHPGAAVDTPARVPREAAHPHAGAAVPRRVVGPRRAPAFAVLLWSLLAWSACDERVRLDAGAVARGAERYRASGCAACHGPTGRGDGPAAVATQRRPRDFARPGDFVTPRTLRAVAAVIRDGLPGTSMPANPDLDADERQELAAFVLSLGEAQGTKGSPP